MTRDDGSQRRLAATARPKPAKTKRTKGVGRTGARFPATSVLEPEAPAATFSQDLPPEGDPPAEQVEHADQPDTHNRQTPTHNPLPGAPAPAPHPSATTSASSAPPAASPALAVPDPAVGGTGARFGPYSVRKPKRTKESAEGHALDVDASTPVERPPGEPAPEQSAERTVPLVLPWAGALVRPYAHTAGRTRASHDFALEALISSRGNAAADGAVLTTHHRRTIVELCTRPRSVAEVAALLSVPLGVARVLLGDLAAAGVVVVHPTAANTGDGAPDVAFMRRVLVGLQRL